MASVARSVPTKGFFVPSPSRTPSSDNVSRSPAQQAARGGSGGAAPMTASDVSATRGASLAGADGTLAGSLPSSVPKGGRRRESVGAQMRKQFTDSPAAAAAGVGSGLIFQRSTGQTIATTPPLSRFGAGRPDAASLSTSLGAVSESMLESRVPSKTMRERQDSVSSVATDDDAKSGTANGDHGLHRCEACNKVYRHPNCLVKHRWEHTAHWKEASRFSMSKHQQVQLLEAAAILVGMDVESHSLPDEKALWPAAVSPPSSGLLGSDKINLEMLLRQKAARKSLSPMVERRSRARSLNERAPSHLALPPSSVPASGAGLSPLNSFTLLSLDRRVGGGGGGGGGGGSGAAPSSLDGAASFRLDESAERSMREESVDSEDDDEDDEDGFGGGNDSMTGSTSISAGSPSHEGSIAASDKHVEIERYGVGAGGDVMAEMEMDMEDAA